jgi:hypothetical protein
MKLKTFDAVDNLTGTQYLMIKACLANSKAERERAVREWEKAVVIDTIDFSSSRLIPWFFYGNQQHDITTVHDKRMKVIYKHWWLRSQHISHRLKEVHKAFCEAGIDSIIIKGASIKTHYDRDELRPMADFDLLVHPTHLQKALQIIKDLGYLPNENLAAYLQKRPSLFLDFNHAITCQKKDSQLDLHWRVGSRCSTKFSDDLWLHLENYEPVPQAKRPQLAYEVFMLLVHAADSENRDNLNWIIDIAVINNKADRSFWKEARKLAVAEKKEDLFDYSCSILVKLGVDAPDPGPVKKPKVIISTDPEDRQQMSPVRLFVTRLRNIIHGVNRLFPHAHALGKVYQITKSVYYHFTIRETR